MFYPPSDLPDIQSTVADPSCDRRQRDPVPVAVGLGGRSRRCMPIARHWTARLEYLFTDYGKTSATYLGTQPMSTDFSSRNCASV